MFSIYQQKTNISDIKVLSCSEDVTEKCQFHVKSKLKEQTLLSLMCNVLLCSEIVFLYEAFQNQELCILETIVMFH